MDFKTALDLRRKNGLKIFLILATTALAVLMLFTVPDSVTRESSPPEISLLVDEETVSGAEGSYCWNGRCVDKVGPVELAEKLDTTSISESTALRFQTEGSEPSEYHYTLFNRNGSTITRDTSAGSFNLPSLEPSTYVLLGSGRWKEGDVSYAFLLNLTA